MISLAKLMEIAPNIMAKANTAQSGQAFPQAAVDNNYGNFVQDMQQQANNQALNNTMNELRLQNPQEQAVVAQPANDINGVKNKLLSSLTDLKRGYSENYNNGFSPENWASGQFTETTPANVEKLQAYQQQLLSQGVDPNVVGAVALGRNSGNKDIDNWIKANPDAFNATTKTYEKTPMARFGEALGTAARFAQSPTGQALIQGGLSALINDDWGEGAATALKAAQDRATSNMYQKALEAEGIPTGNMGLFGNISNNTFSNLVGRADKKWNRDFQISKEERAQRNADREYERKVKADENTANYRKEKLSIDRTKAANRRSGGGGGSKAPKLTDNPNYRKALAQFVNAKGPKRDYARSRIIELFGVDPETKVKQVQKQDSLFDDED